jgi:hypothetical protein
MSYSEIRQRLDQAQRTWTRLQNSAVMNQRHEADRMVQFVADAEAVLLKTASRTAYDARWRNRQSDGRYPSSASTTRTGRYVDVPARSGSAAAPGETVDHAQLPAGPAAGIPWRAGSDPLVPSGQDDRRSYSAENAEDSIERSWFGWTTVRGTVVHLDPTYTVPTPRNWLRIVLALVTFPVMALVALFVLSFWLASRIMFSRFMRPMDINHLLIMLFTLHRNGGRRPQVPVRDLRVRDSGGVEHSVRLVGQLIGASVNVGDDVTLSGFSWGGTINARRGMNHRTRAIIRVRT